MELKEYEQRKFALAEIVRTAQALNTNDSWLSTETAALLARIAEDRFNLLVVGRFNRGKSTLLNALLGADYLPTGIVPLTSVITTVRYGSRKQAVLNFANSRLTTAIPLSRLAEFVTETSNPGNVKRLTYAEIQLRVELLRRGLFFVDSPGIGSSITENTLTTERFLPQADAFVLVTSHDSPLSEDEDRILQRIEAANKPLYILINKQDTVSDEERAQVWNFVNTRLGNYAFQQKPLIFSISARQGLAAAQAQDHAGMQNSGIMAFEEALLSFLKHDRADQFLKNMHDRIRSFLVQALARPEQSDFVETLQSLFMRLTEPRQCIIGSKASKEDTLSTHSTVVADAPSLVLDRTSGCHVCGAILKEVSRFLASYQYELTISTDAREDHALRGGFCPLHTWQYEAIASPQGVCVSYPRLVHRMATHLFEFGEQWPPHDDPSEQLRQLAADATACRVCEVRSLAESASVRDLASIISANDGEPTSFPACCLPHLTQVVAALGPGGDAARAMLRSHASLLERIAEDLERFALKHYALRRGLASEEERSAAKLALVLLVGHRDTSAPKIAEGFI